VFASSARGRPTRTTRRTASASGDRDDHRPRVRRPLVRRRDVGASGSAQAGARQHEPSHHPRRRSRCRCACRAVGGGARPLGEGVSRRLGEAWHLGGAAPERQDARARPTGSRRRFPRRQGHGRHGHRRRRAGVPVIVVDASEASS
jgi:hypothetical protein